MNSKLSDFVYHGLQHVNTNNNKEMIDYLIARCILAPLNRDVKESNDLIMGRLPGKAIKLVSIDTPDPDGFDSLPEECLNMISVSGPPEHPLLLKVGMPAVVTRNLNIAGGICNGTRLLIKDLSRSYIKGLLMTGLLRGRQVMIP
jgi:ATP-dependent DNA helicase PIF1